MAGVRAEWWVAWSELENIFFGASYHQVLMMIIVAFLGLRTVSWPILGWLNEIKPTNTKPSDVWREWRMIPSSSLTWAVLHKVWPGPKAPDRIGWCHINRKDGFNIHPTKTSHVRLQTVGMKKKDTMSTIHLATAWNEKYLYYTSIPFSTKKSETLGKPSDQVFVEDCEN